MIGNLKFGILGYSGVSLYQKWTDYPDSPVLTANYPYQLLYNYGGAKFIGSTTPIYKSYDGSNRLQVNGQLIVYSLQTGAWVYSNTATTQRINSSSTNTIIQANNDVYTDSSYTTVFFAKTT